MCILYEYAENNLCTKLSWIISEDRVKLIFMDSQLSIRLGYHHCSGSQIILVFTCLMNLIYSNINKFINKTLYYFAEIFIVTIFTFLSFINLQVLQILT